MSHGGYSMFNFILTIGVGYFGYALVKGLLRSIFNGVASEVADTPAPAVRRNTALDEDAINPANGAPMVGMIDVYGNAYGASGMGPDE